MSKSWNDEEYYRRLKLESRRRVRRSTGFFSLAMIALIVIIAILGNPQIVLVATMLIAIVLVGIFFALFVSNFDVDWGIKSLTSTIVGRKPLSEEDLQGRDPAKSMNVFVKHAALGSEYSRREIALELKHLLIKFGLDDTSFIARSPQLKADFQKVVYDYDDHKEAKKGRFALTKRKSRREREAYLDSLQRIIKQIESI